MEFSNSAVDMLQTIVVGLGGTLCVWGGVNLLEGYGTGNPVSKNQGVKQLVAGGGVTLTGMTLVPLLSGLLGQLFDPSASNTPRPPAVGRTRKRRDTYTIDDLIGEWIKGILTDRTKGNLSGLFSTVNTKVEEITSDAGSTPQDWNDGILSMLRTLSETVTVPIAVVIPALVMCYELIEMIVEKNNTHDFDTFLFFRWMFKSAFAILITTNTWNIIMGVFDAT